MLDRSFPTIPDPPALSALDREWLGIAAWQALWTHLGVTDLGVSSSPRSPPETSPTPAVATLAAGVFVTLTHEGDLRGCLGAVAPAEPLAVAVPRLALAAATRDRRFEPLTTSKGLETEITVLGPLIDLSESKQAILAGLDPRVHGVQVKLGAYAGVLLPQVACRYGWSALELLRQVSVKAGLEADAWRAEEAQVFAFRCVSFAAVRPGRAPA